MKNKITILLSACLIMLLCSCLPEAHAYGKSGCKSKGLEGKFSSKIHTVLMNKEELGLSDTQVDKLKELKIATKKDIIRKNAEIDVVALDIKSEMWEDKVDTSATDALVEKKYDLKKEKAKTLIRAYADIKNILTSEQCDKLKELYKKQAPGCGMPGPGAGMMGGKR